MTRTTRRKVARPAERPLRTLARDELVQRLATSLEERDGVAGAHYVEWLPLVYEVTARFEKSGRGRSNIYLVLLDYEDSPRGPYGVYVGATQYTPAARFDQHKAGIRAAGSVLKRGLEVLTGPVLHLQGLKRAQAEEIEEGLAEALRAEGLVVQGGH